MNKKIGLYISGRKLDIEVEEAFAKFLEAQMAKDFNIEGNNEIKTVLHAYVRKNYELFQQEIELEAILQKLEV